MTRTIRVVFLVPLIALSAVCFLSKVCFGFNIDLSTHVEYRRPPETLFGFSVAAHQEANTGW